LCRRLLIAWVRGKPIEQYQGRLLVSAGKTCREYESAEWRESYAPGLVLLSVLMILLGVEVCCCLICRGGYGGLVRQVEEVRMDVAEGDGLGAEL